MDVKMNKALFLDRDNTIIYDSPYMADPDKVKIMTGVVDALCKFRKSGYMLIIVTNQSGIARGCFTEEEMHKVNRRMQELFESENIVFDDIFFCPHAPEGGCLCRKPAPGMLLAAVEKYDVDIAQSIMIGDKTSDIEAGIAAGCGTNIWLAHDRKKVDPGNRFLIADNLIDAVEILHLSK
jgi:D-glycero-D-manno-heptose 1,7-bisphosphate phosphatase